MLDIEVAMDHVVIEGQRVIRPDHVSRSEWQRFWERATQTEDDEW